MGTSTFYATQTKSWRHYGWRSDNQYIYQGMLPSVGSVYMHTGVCWFDAATIKSALNGQTVDSVRLRLFRPDTQGVNEEVPVYMGRNGYSADLSTQPTARDGYTHIADFDRGENKWITLDNKFAEGFRDNDDTCFVFYTTDETDYGYLYFIGADGTASEMPCLEITYHPTPIVCTPPTSLSVADTVAEGDTTLSWSGAASGANNAITGYEIQYSDSSNNTSWGSWTALSTVTSTDTSGTLTVSPPSTRGNYRRFRIRALGEAGENYYSSWKISDNTVRKNTPPSPPTTVTASPAVYDTEPITLSWSGASGGTSPIKGYMIASTTSTDGENWSGWNVIETFNLSASSGSRTVPASSVSGMYTRYGMWTIDTLDVYSNEKASNAIQKTKAMPTPALSAPIAGSYTYNTSPRVFITTGTDSDGRGQVVQVKISGGDRQDSVNNSDLFSVNGLLDADIATTFKPQTQTVGSKTITVRVVDEDLRSTSESINRTVTILASPFETIVANETTVKATHMRAIRTAVNNIRTYYGLTSTVWTEEITAKKTLIRNWKKHIDEIRGALEEIIETINDFDDSTAFHVPLPDWTEIENTRPSAAAMVEIQELILTL